MCRWLATNLTARCFRPAWTVEDYRGISYIVRDANNCPVAYVYFESEPGRRAAANLMTKEGCQSFGDRSLERSALVEAAEQLGQARPR
jgi:hypothetical protein